MMYACVMYGLNRVSNPIRNLYRPLGPLHRDVTGWRNPKDTL